MLWFDGFHDVLYQRADYEVSIFERRSSLLAEQNHRWLCYLILSVDLFLAKGCGRPSRKNCTNGRIFWSRKIILNRGVYSLSTLDRMLNTIVDDNSGPVVLVGHGLGGWLALRFATHSPDSVERVIVINPSGFEQHLELPKNIPETEKHLEMMFGKGWHFGFVLRDWLEFFENPMQEEIRKEMLLSKKLHREKRADQGSSCFMGRTRSTNKW